MTTEVADTGWLVAGVILMGSGAGLLLRTRARASGALFASAGGVLVAAVLSSSQHAAAIGVVAMVLLTLATAAYPRLSWDLARILAFGGATFGTLLVARRLDGAEGLDGRDVAWIAFALVAVGGSHLWWRLETADAPTRSSLLWVVSTAGVTLFLIGIVALAGTPPGLAAVIHAGLGLVGVAALLGAHDHVALDGRWLASRVAAWCFSVGCAFALATLVLTLAAWRSGSAPGAVTLAVAGVVCGVLWNPLLALVQRVSDGVLFGFRPDALTAAERVAVGVGDDPTAAIRAIQEGLALPYAALDLLGEEPIQVGDPPEHRRVFPIDLDDRHIGDLVVGVRPGDLGLSRDDERVLTLALPILVQTIRARASAAHLQRARVASASAREEERRRLRRDLHDGLGPRLTGIAFTADAARLASTAQARDPMIDRIRREAEVALDEIRELVYGLRPPALDELGLLGAIKLKAEAFDGLPVTVEGDTPPELPAAVEVAAYRMVMEALTNVARHSGATHASVALDVNEGNVVVRVADDGHNDRAWVPGIGLTSMKERAAELGGTVTLSSTSAGSEVTALLPLGPTSSTRTSTPRRTSR